MSGIVFKKDPKNPRESWNLTQLQALVKGLLEKTSLNNIEDLLGEGILVKNGNNSWVLRCVAVSGNGFNSVVNSKGKQGNPTISLNIGVGAEQVAAGNHNHAASEISNIPFGNIESTDIQAVVNELDTEKEPALGNPDVDLKVLASTIAGARSWIIPAGTYVHPNHSGDVTSVADGATTIVNKVTMTATSPVAVSGSPTVIAGGAVAISMPAATNAAAGHATAAHIQAIEANTAKVTNATHSGEVTGATALTITDKAVTYAKIQDLAADKVLGAITAGAPVEIACTAFGRSLIDDATAAAAATTLGLGTTDGPTFKKLHLIDSAYPVSDIIRTTDATNTFSSAATLITRSSGDAIDGFGGGLVFSIQDTGVTDFSGILASIGAVRAGADNTGDMVLRTYTAGTPNERVRIQSNGNVGIGTAAATAKLHLPACAAAANSASLKINPGTVATTPVSGNIESDGTHIYWTDSGGTRRQLDN